MFVEPPEEGPEGPYDRIFFIGNQGHLIGEVPPEKRIQTARGQDHIILGYEKDSVRILMNQVSGIVNDKTKSPENDHDKLVYQRTIMPVFGLGTEELHNILKSQGAIESENYVVMSPLKGGEFCAAALIHNARKLGWKIPFNKFACFDLKRVLMPNKDLYVGARIGFMPEINQDTQVVVADDCISSDASADISLRLAGQTSRRPIAMVAAASQVGIKGLWQKHNALTIAGRPIFRLDGSLYLMTPSNEESYGSGYAVGDMGKWLWRLNESFDQRAEWNVVRRNLVDHWEVTNKLPAI